MITQQPKLVEILLKVGADPTLLDRDGRTAVHLAAHAGDEAILRVLINMLGERHSQLLNTADFSGELYVSSRIILTGVIWPQTLRNTKE